MLTTEIYGRICRICMLKKKKLKSLNDSIMPQGMPQMTMLAMIQRTIPHMQVYLEFPVPKEICELCMEQLQVSYKFNALCLSSNDLLEKIWLNYKKEDGDENAVEQRKEGADAVLEIECDPIKVEINAAQEDETGDVDVGGPVMYAAFPSQNMEIEVKDDEDENDDSYEAIKDDDDSFPEASEDNQNSQKEMHRRTNRLANGRFPCDQCSVTFEKSTNLFHHRKKHQAAYKVICPICFDRYLDEKQLNRHHKIAHKEEGDDDDELDSSCAANKSSEAINAFKKIKVTKSKIADNEEDKNEDTDEEDIPLSSMRTRKEMDAAKEKEAQQNTKYRKRRGRPKRKQKTNTALEESTNDMPMQEIEEVHIQLDEMPTSKDDFDGLNRSTDDLDNEDDHHNDYDESNDSDYSPQQPKTTKPTTTKPLLTGGYDCDECEAVLPSEKQLDRHKRKHDGKHEVVCVTCSDRFRYPHQLDHHTEKHHPELWVKPKKPKEPILKEEQKKHPCQYCSSIFNCVGGLAQHMTRKHPDIRPFKCDKCEESFGVEEHLKLHVNRHLGIKNFHCEFCDKAFSFKQALKLHMTIHTGDMKYLCTLCGKKFYNPGHLQQHMQTHGDEKPYACPHCPKRFKTSSARYTHLYVHQEERKHVCAECGATFARVDTYKQHLMLHNAVQKQYKCDQCDVVCKRLMNLHRHIRTHTGEKPYKCKYCDKSYAQSGDLNKHLRTHVGENTYMCEQCPLAFKYLQDLKKHEWEHYRLQKEKQMSTKDNNDVDIKMDETVDD